MAGPAAAGRPPSSQPYVKLQIDGLLEAQVLAELDRGDVDPVLDLDGDVQSSLVVGGGDVGGFVVDGELDLVEDAELAGRVGRRVGEADLDGHPDRALIGSDVIRGRGLQRVLRRRRGSHRDGRNREHGA